MRKEERTMNKTHGPYLTSWPIPVDFHEALSFQSFKDCFTSKKQDSVASREIDKAENEKAEFTP